MQSHVTHPVCNVGMSVFGDTGLSPAKTHHSIIYPGITARTG